MIFSGRQVIACRLVRNLQDISHQQQPCGIDLTLAQVSKWTSPATIDFDNTKRQAARVSSLTFDETNHSITLQQGSYLIDFNETVNIPHDCMASMYTRSSLWRSGVVIHAGLVDAGYEGVMGALMEVKNPFGVILHRNAKLAQIVFEQMTEPVAPYSGIYQSSTGSAGRDGIQQER